MSRGTCAVRRWSLPSWVELTDPLAVLWWLGTRIWIGWSRCGVQSGQLDVAGALPPRWRWNEPYIYHPQWYFGADTVQHFLRFYCGHKRLSDRDPGIAWSGTDLPLPVWTIRSRGASGLFPDASTLAKLSRPVSRDGCTGPTYITVVVLAVLAGRLVGKDPSNYTLTEALRFRGSYFRSSSSSTFQTAKEICHNFGAQRGAV